MRHAHLTWDICHKHNIHARHKHTKTIKTFWLFVVVAHNFQRLDLFCFDFARLLSQQETRYSVCRQDSMWVKMLFAEKRRAFIWFQLTYVLEGENLFLLNKYIRFCQYYSNSIYVYFWQAVRLRMNRFLSTFPVSSWKWYCIGKAMRSASERSTYFDFTAAAAHSSHSYCYR